MADKGRRQQPGYACEECRRRKARCDRARPTCGLCLESSTVCVILDRKPQRGPKKGRINAMRSQIATLQWQLSQQLGGYDVEDLAGVPGILGHTSPERDLLDPLSHVVDFDSGDDLLNTGVDLSIASHHIISPTSTTHGLATSLVHTVDPSPLEIGWTDWTTTTGFGSDLGLGGLDMAGRDENIMETGRTTPAEPAIAILTDHVRADLDQVFFERVHPVLPIVYRRRYFSWADQTNPGPARVCLRSAIRTIAAAMSALCFRFCDQLYAETRSLLEGYTVGSKDEIALDYIQAWLLLAHYELLRVGEQQALLTAARAFRLVLIARLYNIDLPNPEDMTPPPLIYQQQASPVESLTSCEPADLVGPGGEGGFSAIEERRRTFWLGFQLDRLLCARNDYPLTIYEDMISTRLPAPEANFQGNHYTRTTFLSDAIHSSGKTPTLSPFAECVVLASLHGRCAARSRDTHAPSPRTPGSGTGDFWTQQAGLASAFETRMQALATSASSASGSGDGDALLLFAHMLAHGAVIKLAAAAATQQGGPSPSASAWGQMTTVEQQRAAAAAAEIVRLARLMPSSACFKAHPFLPDPLASAAGYLITGATGGGGGHSGIGNTADVEQLVRVLRDMEGMNSLARDHVTGLMLSTDGAPEFVRGSDLESTSGPHGRVGTASTAQMQRMHR